MPYVCDQLSNPNVFTGSQICQNWVELEQQNTGVPTLPELTTAERDQLLIWIIGIFALVFAVKRLRRMLGS